MRSSWDGLVPGALLALLLASLLAVAAAGCAGAGSDMAGTPLPDGGGGADAGGSAPACVTDADCAYGQRCQAGRCVAAGPDGGTVTDAGPPEDEHFLFQPPVASQNYVFVVNTSLGTVAKIDPGGLEHIEVDSIEVCNEPTELIAVPGSDSAVVLCVGSRSVALLLAGPERDRVIEAPVGQAYTALALSPGGRFAVAYFDQDQVIAGPDSAANKIAVVDLRPAYDDSGPPLVYEYAVGYRVTDLLFDTVDAAPGVRATRALVVSKSEVAVLPLEQLAATWILPRVWIDNPAAEVVEAREVLATPDARLVLVRSFQAAELTVLDIDAGRSALLPLHGVATDIDLAPDGRRALVVERNAGRITRLDLEADLEQTVTVDGRRYFDPDGDGLPEPGDYTSIEALDPAGDPLAAGQAELFVTPDDELAALIYTNAARREEVSILDVERMQIDYLGRLLNKLVDYTVLSPGGRVALIVHRPEPGSPESDPVEREIDALHGYTLIDLPTRATFQQVTEAPIGPLSFSPTGRHAFLTVFDGALEVNELHVLDLHRLTLQLDSVPLAAAPISVGVLPGGRIAYVSQQHDYGKITFVDMETMEERAVTGFELNAR